jgi:DNA-binding protein H-NS
VTQFVGPNGETWAGRGRKPKWLIEAEAAASDSA